jgi:hypothetical protein
MSTRRRPSQRITTGLIFGAACYAIAYYAGASPLWAAVVGLAGAAIAVALT